MQEFHWEVLLESTPMEEKGRGEKSRNEQRESLGCNAVSAKASCPLGGLKLEWPFQVVLIQEGVQAFMTHINHSWNTDGPGEGVTLVYMVSPAKTISREGRQLRAICQWHSQNREE